MRSPKTVADVRMVFDPLRVMAGPVEVGWMSTITIGDRGYPCFGTDELDVLLDAREQLRLALSAVDSRIMDAVERVGLEVM